MKKIEQWWDRLSLATQLLLGGVMAVGLWLAWATVGIRIAFWAWLGEWLPWHALDIASLGKETGEKISALGQIGDLFGGVNALFAAFAFVGVAIAAHYQQKTFKIQAEQNIRQSFEPLFFKLLDRHCFPVGLIYRGSYQGAEATTLEISGLIEDLRAEVDGMLGPNVLSRDNGEVKILIVHAFAPFYEANSLVLEPYFRKLYHLFKLISSSDLNGSDKVRYANIARASLNKDELLLILLNGVLHPDTELKSLIEEFGLLKHITRWKGDKASLEAIVADGFYSPTATMSSSERINYWQSKPEKMPSWVVEMLG